MTAPSKAERLKAAMAERDKADRAWAKANRVWAKANRARAKAFQAWTEAYRPVQLIEDEQ